MIQGIKLLADACDKVNSQVNWETLRSAMILFSKAVAEAQEEH